MKKAILISGRAGSGKTPLASKIKMQFEKTGYLQPDNPIFRWLGEGTDSVLVEDITSHEQLTQFIRHIQHAPITVRKSTAKFEVDPFYIFTSQRIRFLRPEFLQHIGHVDCYNGGVCMVNLDGLPQKVIGAIHGHAEKPGNFSRSAATA